METKKTYGEKLEDPRWQKKRLLIFQRDEWKCRLCNDDSETLHVHHDKYEYGKDPWEVDDEFLRTLCKQCHSFVEWMKEVEQFVPISIKKSLTDDKRACIIAVKFSDQESKDSKFIFHYKKEFNWELFACLPNKMLKEMYEF